MHVGRRVYIQLPPRRVTFSLEAGLHYHRVGVEQAAIVLL